ncbi:BnaC03g72200D [Brassica napus]|uniref:BnaC03g72200D protein n=2 Tax=Brassica TaxID=3705 RepID=A0A078JAH8_BRANA|nr:BnaC03g72200D [Brassica napus]VDC89617.1 unnamed protein product [Brassica oleracea]
MARFPSPSVSCMYLCVLCLLIELLFMKGYLHNKRAGCDHLIL